MCPPLPTYRSSAATVLYYFYFLGWYWFFIAILNNAAIGFKLKYNFPQQTRDER